MKYFVVTTKHHEGFCLWDTKLTDYKATNTPYRQDLLKPMVEAFRENGLRVGFYHSLLDWHHPDYTADAHHPMRDNPDYIAGDKDRDLNRYAAYLRGQTRELLTQFGPIDILWYDFSVGPTEKFAGKGKEVWQSEKLIELVRELQPNIILNDRLQIDSGRKDAGAVSAARMGARGRQAGRVGSLPDVQRLVGLSPRRGELEDGGDARQDAD